MVSSLSPCCIFCSRAGDLASRSPLRGPLVYADRVIQVKQGMRGKPGGPLFPPCPLVALKAQASYPDACHKSFQGGSWTAGGSTRPSMGPVKLARTTSSRAKFWLPVNNRKFTGDFSAVG